MKSKFIGFLGERGSLEQELCQYNLNLKIVYLGQKGCVIPMNPQDFQKNITPRTPRKIIEDIGGVTYNGTTVDAYLGIHIEILQGDHAPNFNKKLYGKENPLPDFMNLRIALRNLARNPDQPPGDDDRKALSAAFETLEMLIHHDLDNAMDTNTDIPTNRELMREHLAASRNAMDASYQLQGLIVELCEHYGIPTKRQPPRRIRS